MWAQKLRPPLARLTANAGPIDFRPQEITKSGQGGSNGSLNESRPINPGGQSRGGTQRQGDRSRIVFSIKGSPTASANPTACVTIPAMPSVKIQATLLFIGDSHVELIGDCLWRYADCRASCPLAPPSQPCNIITRNPNGSFHAPCETPPYRPPYPARPAR